MLKFKVVGTNVKTSARMVIEVEAQNRAAAERAATATGMEVLHVEHVPDDPLAAMLKHVQPTHPPRRQEPPAAESHRGRWIVAAVALLLIGVAVVVFWSKIRGMVNG